MALEIRDMITPGNANAFTVGDRKAGASLADLPAVHRALLEDEPPVTAMLATTNANGRPQLTPVWVSHDGDRVNLNSTRDRLKDRNMRARPEVSLATTIRTRTRLLLKLSIIGAKQNGARSSARR